MPKCAVKMCKNNSRKVKKRDGISYFHFPVNLLLKETWRKIIAQERREEFYRPNKSSVVCSDHFSESDMYYTAKGIRRLKRDAVLVVDINEELEQMNNLADSVKTQDRGGTPLSIFPTEIETYFKSEASTSTARREIYPESLNLRTSKKADLSRIPNITSEQRAIFSPTSSGLSSILNTPKTSYYKKTLRERNNKIKVKTKLIKILQQQNRRLKKRNHNLKSIVQELKKKRLIDEGLSNDLQQNRDESNILSILTAEKKKTFSKYPPAFRKFALTLNFYSPAAYKYLRSIFNNRLPHPNTMFNWYKNVNAQPGFTEEAMSRLADKAKTSTEPLLCAMVIDEMSIRKQKIWTGTKYEGLIDMGIGSTDSDLVASQVYVFMVVSLDQSWKLPIAYFYIQNLTGEMKANLIKIALQKCNAVGVKIVAVTFDGCKSNISCMKSLGCKIDEPENMQTLFPHPCGSDEKVAVFLDACHMVKLIRNLFESKKILYDSNDCAIKWDLVVALHNLQEENSLHLANKLTVRHVQFRNQIMKVKLATQLLSESVAKAIEFCGQHLKINEFSHSQATVKFIKIINNLFDVMNSRNLNDFGFSRPLNRENSTEILAFCAEAKKYLLSLKTRVTYKKTIKVGKEKRVIYESKIVPLYKCNVNTGVIGLLVCINSLEQLYTKLIETNTLRYLCLYKFSQDHVELFFGKVRSQGGHNNNPNTRQFKAAYKKILSHLELNSKFSGNCFPLENIPILKNSSPIQNINKTTRNFRQEDEIEVNFSKTFVQNRLNQEQDLSKYSNNCEQLIETFNENFTEITIQIIGYISGFVVFHLLKKLTCDDCKNHLLASKKEHFHKLVDLKDVGGLCFASEDVFLLCKKSERVIRDCIQISGGKTLLKKYDKSYLTAEIIKYFVEYHIFSKTDAHTRDQFNHIYDLMKAVIHKYIDVRLHYICKKENIEKTQSSKRQLYNKLNLFQGN